MPLEAVMICVDNSDFTRNGDYAPTRFESQTDAVNLVCGAKTTQNPENAVGILVTAGDRVEVMITPTMDLGKMMAELPKIQIGGNADLIRGIQTAQLALKHRQNKNQKQRVVAFVGSPILATDKELETLGKNLKKNNVSLDLVSFGEVDENTPKLELLLNFVNSNGSSHIVEVPVGPKLLSDVLLSSVIVNPDGEAAGMAGGGGGDGFEFGINPSDDPELALALRISMEEERARQQAVSGDAPPAEGAGDSAAPGAAAPPAQSATVPAGATAADASMPMADQAALMEAMGMEDMDEELRQALLLSMQDDDPAQSAAAPAEAKPAEEAKPAADATKPDAAGAGAAAADESMDAKWFKDKDFMSELLGSLPGVDINDPRIQSALKDVSGDGEKDKDKKDDKKDDKSEGSGGSGSGSGGDASGSK